MTNPSVCWLMDSIVTDHGPSRKVHDWYQSLGHNLHVVSSEEMDVRKTGHFRRHINFAMRLPRFSAVR